MLLPTREMDFWEPAEKNCQKAKIILLGAWVCEKNHNVSHEIIYFSNFSLRDVECGFEDHIEIFPPVVWNVLPQ